MDRYLKQIALVPKVLPPDVVILSVDRPYALVGQSHPGFMGVIQRSLSRGAAHIWFQRSEAKDRLEVGTITTVLEL